MASKVLSIAQDFSRFPAGRYRSDGPYSGQRFREEFLLPALVEAERSGDDVIVDLDGAFTYSSSFLEEAFGGLVRSDKVAKGSIQRLLKIMANDIAFLPAKVDAEKYIFEEMRNRR